MSGRIASSPAAAIADFLRKNRVRFPTAAAFAREVGLTAGRLSQILAGHGGKVRADTAIRIHIVTRGAVPGNVTRPDLWLKASDVPVTS
jgi:hypothetical protein